MSLCDIPRFISAYLLVPRYSHPEALDDVLQPSLDAENRLRRVLAHGRDDLRLADPYIGLVNLFDLPSAMRLTQSRHGRGGHPTDPLWKKEYVFPLRSDQRRQHGTPSVVPTLATFKHNFKIFTSGAFEGFDWSNVVVAGGSVLACVTPPPAEFSENDLLGEYFHDIAYRTSDVDIFIYGLSEVQAKTKMLQIYWDVKKALNFPTLCIRKKHTVTIICQYPYRHIQIVLRLYMSPAEIIAGFDIDSACVMYDGTSVYANPRAVVALARQSNTIDLSRRSPSYEHRLFKYSQRGFEVRLPGLTRELVRDSIFDADMPPPMPKGLARLLILENIALGRVYVNFEKPRSRKLEGNERSPSPSAATLSLDAASAQSWYDSGLLRIPYGPQWNVKKIKKLLGSMKERLEYISAFDIDGEPTVSADLIGHYHGFFYGTMIECIGHICPDCPSTVSPRHDYGLGDGVQGPLKFITDNPGQQLMTGSFHPVDGVEWGEEAYRPAEFALPFMDVWLFEDCLYDLPLC